MGSIADLVIEKADLVYEELEKDPNSRFRSWEYCYKSFSNARKNPNPDYDYLCLQLAFYLASWGMYRGSSFLLQKDYKIHREAVEIILSRHYDCLLGLECENLKKPEIQDCLNELYSLLEKHYEGIRAEVKGMTIENDISPILITKILLGTLACVPAYDEYFCNAVRSKKHNVTTGVYSIDSVLKLAEFYENNKSFFEEKRLQYKFDNEFYPQMKYLDMALWKIGIDEKGE